MRILIDTNILFSALLFPKSKPAQALLHVADKHEMVLCDRNIKYLIFKFAVTAASPLNGSHESMDQLPAVFINLIRKFRMPLNAHDKLMRRHIDSLN